MSGMAPLFTTAPRIEIKLFDAVIAYAIGLNVNVSVSLQPVKVIGKFGAISWEPTMYNVVTGTLQILRVKSTVAMDAAATVAKGNIGNSFNNPALVAGADGKVSLTPTGDATTDLTLDSNSPLSQSRLHDHLNPKNVLLSTTFDLDLYMRVPAADNSDVTKLLSGNNTTASSAVIGAQTMSQLYDSVSWMRITNCRISSRNTNLALGQLVNEPLSFQGLLLAPTDQDINEVAANLFIPDAGVTQVS